MDENPSKEAPASESGAEKTTSNPKKALSIVALVFGILGLISCAGGPIALVLCLVGVICGIVALVKKQQKGMAIAGLICGAVGIIPALLFSFLWGSVAMLFGGAGSFADDPIGYCKENPSNILCIEGADIEINGKKIETKTDDSDGTKKDDAKKNDADNTKKTDTDNIKNTDTDNTKKDNADNSSKNNTSSATGWTYDYLKKLAKEEGRKISDVPQEYIDAFKDFEVCLADAGIDINSPEEFEALKENSDDLSLDQALGYLGCAMSLASAVEDVDDGGLDLDL